MAHVRTLSSALALARRRPLGLQAKDVTALRWPASSRRAILGASIAAPARPLPVARLRQRLRTALRGVRRRAARACSRLGGGRPWVGRVLPAGARRLRRTARSVVPPLHHPHCH
jgi:HEAT repeat protein